MALIFTGFKGEHYSENNFMELMASVCANYSEAQGKCGKFCPMKKLCEMNKRS